VRSNVEPCSGGVRGLTGDWIASWSADARHEPSAAFVGGGLRQVDILNADLAATPHGARAFSCWANICSRLPHAAAISGWPAALLPIAYIHRMVRAAPRWFRR
jgi:hypothetical protein